MSINDSKYYLGPFLELPPDFEREEELLLFELLGELLRVLLPD
ncbi:MAG: hypothetical protein ACI8X3_000054, partial [Saprospiraceae bacterium]